MEKNTTNMFAKSHEDRRTRFVKENDYVADNIVSTSDNTENQKTIEDNDETGNFLIKKTRQRVKFSTYLDPKVDKFITTLSKLTPVYKVEIINEFLIYSIMNHEDIAELKKQDKKIQKAFEEFINS